MVIRLVCVKCFNEVFEEATEEEIERWESGQYLIQDCFPKMHPEHREMLISGICPTCWNKMFSFDDEISDEIFADEVDDFSEN